MRPEGVGKAGAQAAGLSFPPCFLPILSGRSRLPPYAGMTTSQQILFCCILRTLYTHTRIRSHFLLTQSCNYEYFSFKHNTTRAQGGQIPCQGHVGRGGRVFFAPGLCAPPARCVMCYVVLCSAGAWDSFPSPITPLLPEVPLMGTDSRPQTWQGPSERGARATPPHIHANHRH